MLQVGRLPDCLPLLETQPIGAPLLRTPALKSCATALALAGVVAACDPRADLPVLKPDDTAAGYKLNTGDQIRLITFGEQSLSGEFGIDDSGYVALPLVGPLQAGGLTPQALAAKVTDQLKDRQLLAHPSVVVEVVKYRPIFVLGEVQHPGPYPFQPHMTLLGAVALAGGFTPRALKARAEVVRGQAAGPVLGNLQPLSAVEPGDVITIPERLF